MDWDNYHGPPISPMRPPPGHPDGPTKDEIKDFYGAPSKEDFTLGETFDESAYLAQKHDWVVNNPMYYDAICASKVSREGKY